VAEGVNERIELLVSGCLDPAEAHLGQKPLSSQLNAAKRLCWQKADPLGNDTLLLKRYREALIRQDSDAPSYAAEEVLFHFSTDKGMKNKTPH